VRPRSQDEKDRQDYGVEKIVNDPLSGLERAALASPDSGARRVPHRLLGPLRQATFTS
jgi:hypothetical protein